MKTYNTEKQICLNDFEKTLKFRKKWEIIGHLLQQSIKTLKLEYILSRCNGWRDGSVCVYLVYVLCAYICLLHILYILVLFFLCKFKKKKLKKELEELLFVSISKTTSLCTISSKHLHIYVWSFFLS